MTIDRFDFTEDLSDVRPAPTYASAAFTFGLLHHLHAQVIGLQPSSAPAVIHWVTLGNKEAAVPQIMYQEEKALDQDTMPPSYDSAADVPFLEESLVTCQRVGFQYLPDSTGRVVSLDDSYTGFVNGLGVIQTRCGAKIVSLTVR